MGPKPRHFTPESDLALRHGTSGSLPMCRGFTTVAVFHEVRRPETGVLTLSNAPPILLAKQNLRAQDSQWLVLDSASGAIAKYLAHYEYFPRLRCVGPWRPCVRLHDQFVPESLSNHEQDTSSCQRMSLLLSYFNLHKVKDTSANTLQCHFKARNKSGIDRVQASWRPGKFPTIFEPARPLQTRQSRIYPWGFPE